MRLWGFLLYPGLRRLHRLEDKLLEIFFIYQLLELSPKRAAIHGTVSHSVMEGAVFSSSGTLRVRWEWPRAPHPVSILNGAEDMVHGYFERSVIGSLSVGLGRVPRMLLANCAGSSVLSLLCEGRLGLQLLPLILPLEKQSTVLRVTYSIWMYF